MNLFYKLAAILFGTIAVICCGAAVALDLMDWNFGLPLLLTEGALLNGALAVGVRRLARRK